MANFFKNLTQSITESVTEVSAKNTVDTQRQSELVKLEAQITEINIKLEKQYTLLGKSVADNLRQNESINEGNIQKLFASIQKLDEEQADILEKIKEVKAKQAEQEKGEELLRLQKQVEGELRKLDELKSLGVIDDDEFEVSQVKLKKKINNFEKLYSLRIAFERGLISQEEYNKRKEALE